MRQRGIGWKLNSHHAQTKENISRDVIHQLGTMIQKIFCALSGTGIIFVAPFGNGLVTPQTGTLGPIRRVWQNSTRSPVCKAIFRPLLLICFLQNSPMHLPYSADWPWGSSTCSWKLSWHCFSWPDRQPLGLWGCLMSWQNMILLEPSCLCYTQWLLEQYFSSQLGYSKSTSQPFLVLSRNAPPLLCGEEYCVTTLKTAARETRGTLIFYDFFDTPNEVSFLFLPLTVSLVG